MKNGRYETVDEIKIGDLIEYQPTLPLAPWALVGHIGAIGTVKGFHSDCAIVTLRHGGHITVSYANLVKLGAVCA